MTLLIAGLALFLVPHLMSVFKSVRGSLHAALGAAPYKILYSLISIAGLFLMVKGYGDLRASGDNILLYNPPLWLRPITLLLMVIAIILLMAAYIPSRLKTIVVHPQVAAVKIWAFSHLLSNGDLASVLLFGSLLAWAVIARIAYKRQGLMSVAKPVESWGLTDGIAVVAGIAVYVGFAFWLHPMWIGVAVAG
jgi:uncharacterized membrane protein